MNVTKYKLNDKKVCKQKVCVCVCVLMFLISLFLNELLMIYVTLWLLITLCNMPEGLVT